MPDLAGTNSLSMKPPEIRSEGSFNCEINVVKYDIVLECYVKQNIFKATPYLKLSFRLEDTGHAS